MAERRNGGKMAEWGQNGGRAESQNGGFRQNSAAQ